MKGTIFIENRLYLISGNGEGQVRLLSAKGQPVVTFPTWKKQDWHDETIPEELRTKIASVVDGFRRMARYSKFGIIVGG